MDDYLSIPDAAKLIGISDRTLWAKVRRGEVPAVDLHAGQGQRACWRIKRSDLEAWLSAKKRATAESLIDLD